MANKYEKARKLYKWAEHFFVVMGNWPLQVTNIRFTLWMTYMSIHFFFSQVYLYYALGDLQTMVMNIADSGLMIMVSFRLFMLKFSRKLGKVIQQTIDFLDAKHFRHDEEWELYIRYNRIAQSYFKIVVPIAVATTISFWMKPIQLRLLAALQNETKPYPLAYTTNYFFEIKDDRTFYLIWIYNFPMVFFAPSFTASIGLEVSLIYHISGRLAILSFRIKNLTVEYLQNEQSARMLFQELAQTHLDIVESAKTINSVFGPLLLNELCISTVTTGLTIYATITNIDGSNGVEIFSTFSYGFSMLLLIYSSCAAGEHVVTESSNLYAAYYECLWYDMPTSCKKQLIICMIGASKPIQLSAAGFNNYSRPLFISMIKTAGGYISLLRTMTEQEG